MKRYQPLWVTPRVHKKAKEKAARDGCTIAEAIEQALRENANDNEEKVKNYGLFK